MYRRGYQAFLLYTLLFYTSFKITANKFHKLTVENIILTISITDPHKISRTTVNSRPFHYTASNKKDTFYYTITRQQHNLIYIMVKLSWNIRPTCADNKNKALTKYHYNLRQLPLRGTISNQYLSTLYVWS